MAAVYKYHVPIKDELTIPLPILRGTGQDIEQRAGESLVYVGTTLWALLVFHLFEVTE